MLAGALLTNFPISFRVSGRHKTVNRIHILEDLSFKQKNFILSTVIYIALSELLKTLQERNCKSIGKRKTFKQIKKISSLPL
jgi:hypothetical protein